MFNRRQTLALLGAAAGSAILPFSANAESQPLKTLRIGWQKNGVLALAKGKGALEARLKSRGIDIKWAEFSSGPPLLEALGAGAIDFGPTGDVPPLFAQAAGGNLVYAGTYRGSPSGSGILVAKDAPFRSIADLKGKRVAFKRGSSVHNFTVKALRTAGLKVSDVEAIDLSPSDAAAAFAAGKIDAWAIWDPYFAIAEKRPDARVLTTADGIVESWSFFLSNGEFATQHGDVLNEIIDELASVGRAAQDNLDETVATLSKITGVPEDIQRIILTRKDADLGDVTTISEEAIKYQQALADEFYDLNIVPKKLNVSEIVWKGLPKAG
ncbi:aliphatic sulfonate ABC transporter substrate-binding protein [Phyllobacterium sp. YR531]|uniref:aliphatic sulfonate ABC transporter substrate-binding protein n=1 Tax=Phyllobacterium sp. YR531 TaxID=1144343 RepID=UPI00026F876A|nr:aliphatic sulfonate ABC transporter substrate-binding protein [Phyllobacterium sp. YR531]EJN01364.1 ABC transporter, substrate-binding protein, aliphatic sulfonates family [Phyllobacterium sp. YR531]